LSLSTDSIAQIYKEKLPKRRIENERTKGTGNEGAGKKIPFRSQGKGKEIIALKNQRPSVRIKT
jgi:hypothetical protein